MSDPFQASAAEDGLNELALYADRDDAGRHSEYGPFYLSPALPKLSDNDFQATVERAISEGLFAPTSDGRIKFTLEGRRRAHIARASRGIVHAFTEMNVARRPDIPEPVPTLSSIDGPMFWITSDIDPADDAK